MRRAVAERAAQRAGRAQLRGLGVACARELGLACSTRLDRPEREPGAVAGGELSGGAGMRPFSCPVVDWSAAAD